MEDSAPAAEDVSPEVSEAPVPDTAPEPQDSGPEPADSAAPVGGESVYHAFRTLPQFNGMDDRAIATHLYQSMQREEAATRALQQYQSILPEYMNNRDAFQQWQNSQQQPQQPQQPQQEQPPSWWNPPQLREAYKQYLVKDENGREVISPDAPVDARHALVEYQQYKADFAKKFLENPEDALGPMVEKVATDRAAQIVQAQLGQYQAQQYVSQLEAENKDWLYDQNGNVSPEGLAAQKYIDQAKALGIQGPQQRWDYAVAMVERDLLNAAYQSPPQQQPQPQMPQPAVAPAQPSVAEKNMEYLRQQASRKPSQTTAETTNPRVAKPPRTFAQRLAMQAKDKGLIDPTS